MTTPLPWRVIDEDDYVAIAGPNDECVAELYTLTPRPPHLLQNVQSREMALSNAHAIVNGANREV